MLPVRLLSWTSSNGKTIQVDGGSRQSLKSPMHNIIARRRETRWLA